MEKTLFSLFVLLVSCSAFFELAIKKTVNDFCTLLGVIIKTDFTSDINNQISYLTNKR